MKAKKSKSKRLEISYDPYPLIKDMQIIKNPVKKEKTIRPIKALNEILKFNLYISQKRKGSIKNIASLLSSTLIIDTKIIIKKLRKSLV